MGKHGKRGVGEWLNFFYGQNTLLGSLAGIFYSLIVTVAPMLLIILTIFLLEAVYGFRSLEIYPRELFSDTMTYMFIFSLLVTMPQNAAISQYVSNAVYLEKYDDILPSFYTGLLLTEGIALALSVPFFIHEYTVGGVDALYILISFIGFLSIVLVMYTTIYLNQVKCYMRITLFYIIGMAAAAGGAGIAKNFLKMETTRALLGGMSSGFLVIASLEYAQMLQYFRGNSGSYREILGEFKKSWSVILSNVLYTMTLCVHNFVFWTTDLRMVVADTFVTADAYDMAAFLGLLTNLSASVIFITGIERRFREKYSNMVASITGGRLEEIEINTRRVFRETRQQILELVRGQFVISVAVFLLFIVFLPRMGVSTLVMRIYPCLAAGYFVLFVVYGEMILLNYFVDRKGVLIMSLTFFGVTLTGSIIATHLDPIWYGIGLYAGAMAGWTVGFFRLRSTEIHFDENTFCTGRIIPFGEGLMPSSVSYRKEQKSKD